MLLSRQILDFLSHGFILGDVFGFLPFRWDPDSELVELNLSRKRILGCFLGFSMTVFTFFVLIQRTSFFGGKIGIAGRFDERWDSYFDYLVILGVLNTIVLQICTGLVHKEIPGFVRQIRSMTKQFVGESCHVF